MPGAKSRLIEIDVKEVSLVDAAANKRTFPVVKSAKGQPAEGAATVVKAEGDAPTGDAAPAVEQPPAADAPAAPAAKAAPAHEALLMERLAAARAGLDKIEAGVGTLSKRELGDLVWATQEMLWGIEGQAAVVAMSKSAGGREQPVSEATKSAIAKERGRLNEIAIKADVDLDGAPPTGGEPAAATSEKADEPAAPASTGAEPAAKAGEAEAAALVAKMGSKDAAMRAVLDVSEKAIKAASTGSTVKADPMTTGAQALVEIAGHLGAMRAMQEAHANQEAAEDAAPTQMSAPKAEPAAKVDAPASAPAAPASGEVQKAVAAALAPVLKAVDVLKAQVVQQGKSPSAPQSAHAEGAAPVTKTSKVIWADDMAAAALPKG